MIPDYIDLTESVSGSIQEALRRKSYTSVGVLVDENTYVHCLPHVEDVLPNDYHVLEIKSGEENKTIATCKQIWEKLTKAKFDRNSVLLNLGGGVIGDMGGFCASTFKRGIDFIQIPTTLLSQVDASIGGKLGVDFDGLKNHIGVFRLPEKVIIDPVFLKTLSDVQIISGYAEVIKHGLVFDYEVFDSLRKSSDTFPENWSTVIEKSIVIKNKIVESDPHERGARKLLNFGHTVGHALESMFLEKPGEELLHGEAIAIGMVCETWLSYRKLGLSEQSLSDISNYIINLYGKKDLTDVKKEDFLKRLEQDKKNLGNSLMFTLIAEIGKGKYDVLVSQEEAMASLNYYTEY